MAVACATANKLGPQTEVKSRDSAKDLAHKVACNPINKTLCVMLLKDCKSSL